MRAMTHKALIVGHADGDGHLISEQIRRNLSLIDTFDVSVVVDPARTQGHKSWMKLDAFVEVKNADYVFFVDLMFGPQSFVEEAKALVDFVGAYPEKRFFLIDHHPLPLNRLAPADNLRVIYRPDVSECTLGPRSGMTVVAALCERQFDEVAEVKTPVHDALAVGMRRAAAHGGPLAGEKLLALLRADQWDGLLQLGADDQQFHSLPRGRRPADQPQSDTLRELDETATYLLAHPGDNNTFSGHSHWRRTGMAYDVDVGRQQLSYDAGRPRLLRNVPRSPKDLGVIVTLLEVAALSLTTAPGATFTLDQLIREARKFAGDGIGLDERDIKIVLRKRTFLEKIGNEYRLR
jgi:hypothetical protein